MNQVRHASALEAVELQCKGLWRQNRHPPAARPLGTAPSCSLCWQPCSIAESCTEIKQVECDGQAAQDNILAAHQTWECLQDSWSVEQANILPDSNLAALLRLPVAGAVERAKQRLRQICVKQMLHATMLSGLCYWCCKAAVPVDLLLLLRCL